ncbi:hypothetical protein M2350_002919 [Candidatus Fervidibacter sacchari]|uniref:Uncharacterized protein n=1 Tax=Candidatus Fervidibacter sacchari TaxID=1448929 RepID=A0ABT2ERJ6_9BACT|nr:hypothetical protein [Candidatus Fervidibacter sacchari]
MQEGFSFCAYNQQVKVPFLGEGNYLIGCTTAKDYWFNTALSCDLIWKPLAKFIASLLPVGFPLLVNVKGG